MIDNLGKRIHVGYAEHEIMWIEAAMSLPPRSYERLAAFRDIAEMTGRGIEAIRSKSYQIEGARLDALAAERSAKLFVPARSTPCPQRSRLMAGRA